MSWKKSALIIGAVLVALGYFGLEIIKKESSVKEEAAKKEVEEVKVKLAQAEKEIQEARERAEKERQRAEKEHQERLAEMRKLATLEELHRKEDEDRRRQDQEVVETKAQLEKQRREYDERLKKEQGEKVKQAEKEKAEKSLEAEKDKMRTPALNLKFKYGPLSGEEMAVALVRAGDKVTVRIKQLQAGEIHGERYYVRLGPAGKIQKYGKSIDGFPKDMERMVLFLNDQDSFTVSKKLGVAADVPEDELETEKGCVLYVGSMVNFWNNSPKKGTAALEMDIFETNQWNVKPKSLL